MKYFYIKPQIEIDSNMWPEQILAGSNSERNQYGGTRDNENGGVTLPGSIQETVGGDDSPYSNGQGYGTNRSNESIWED